MWPGELVSRAGASVLFTVMAYMQGKAVGWMRVCWERGMEQWG